MQVLLSLAYAALLGFMITRSGFLIKSRLSKKTLAALFLLYCLAGCVHVMIAFHFFPGHGDVWQIFNYSVTLKDQLLHNYPAFKKEFFPDEFSVDLAGTHMGWSYNEHQWLTALQVAFNFISFDNIYINVLLFNFLTMFGKTALYRMLCERYPGRQMASMILAFLIPGVVFWTAVIHKEGVLFSCIAILAYCLNSLRRKYIDDQGGETNLRHFKGWKIITAALMLLIIFFTRKAVLITLLPGLAIWWMAGYAGIRKKYMVVGVCIVFTLLFMLMGWINSSWSLFNQISERQHAFFQLKGNSRMFLPPVQGNAASFAKVLPYALLNGLFMPLPGTGGSSLYLLFSIEIIASWTLIGWCIIKKKYTWDGFTCGFFVFSVAGCLLVGYIVPFNGAIIRYRSFYNVFILAPFILSLDVRRLYNGVQKNKILN